MKITIITLVDKQDAPEFEMRVRSIVQSGHTTDDVAVRYAADVLTAEYAEAHAEDYVADAENGPSAT